MRCVSWATRMAARKYFPHILSHRRLQPSVRRPPPTWADTGFYPSLHSLLSHSAPIYISGAPYATHGGQAMQSAERKLRILVHRACIPAHIEISANLGHLGNVDGNGRSLIHLRMGGVEVDGTGRCGDSAIGQGGLIPFGACKICTAEIYGSTRGSRDVVGVEGWAAS
jgi:hypothetical protein